VTPAQKSAAEAWPVWDSKEDFAGQKQPKFVLRYREEERVLILEGKARLTPQNGDPPFEIAQGDAVTFRAGFVADWVVLERMRKHYHYFKGGEPCTEPSKAVPVISCDAAGCGKECVEEHWRLEASSEDWCQKCYKVARGPDKRRLATAVASKRGAPVGAGTEAPAAEEKKAKKAKTKTG